MPISFPNTLLIGELYEIKVSIDEVECDGRHGHCHALVLNTLDARRRRFVACPRTSRMHAYTYRNTLDDILDDTLSNLGLRRVLVARLLYDLHRFVHKFALEKHRCPADQRPECIPVPHVSICRIDGVSKHAAFGLETVGATELKLEDGGSSSCAICLDDFDSSVVTGRSRGIVKTPCAHVFHKDCIAGWLKNRCTCPLCRFKLPPAPVRIHNVPIRDRNRIRVT